MREEVIDFASKICSKGNVHTFMKTPLKMKIDGRIKREFHRGNTINLGKKTARHDYWHEFGHHFEENNKRMQKLNQSFLRSRADSDKLHKLSSFTDYKDSELAFKDAFRTPYTGKIYWSGHTECGSMGYQYMMTPTMRLDFALSDFKHFVHTVESLSGGI
jgi:hypothetical protein